MPESDMTGRIKVPNVIDSSEDEARTMLENFTVSTDYTFDDDTPKGYVISQNPPAGRFVRVNDPVIITVSNGPEEIFIDENGNPKDNSKQDGKNEPGSRRNNKKIICIIAVFIIAAFVVLAVAIGLMVLLNSNNTGITDPPESSGEISKNDNYGGWGDSDNGRQSYTIDQINSGALGDTITFNSISDGLIGNEKNFVAAKVSGKKVDFWNADSIEVNDGETYTIRLFVHNNSPKGQEAVARDVRVTFSLPVEISNEQTIIGYLDSTNAQPSRYWDGVTLISDHSFYIEFVEGSARFNNNIYNEMSLDNNIIIKGVPIGYDAMNGEIPGCYEYSCVVTIDVLVHYADDSVSSGEITEIESTEQKSNHSQVPDKSDTEEIGSQTSEVSHTSVTSRTEESSTQTSEVFHTSVTSRTEESSTQPSEVSHTSVTSRTEESSTQSSRATTSEDSQQESNPQTETKVKVPNVVGKSKADAISSLKSAGLIVSTTESYSDTVASGKVISQSLSNGSSVTKNTTVTITVSKGKKPVVVVFDANEGSVNTSSKTVYKGSSYGSLPTPTRDYYDFEGWYTSLSGNTKISSSSTVTLDANHTLYAHWKLKSGILWIEKCGENTTGVFDTNGVLTISGYGRMYDYGNPSFNYGSSVVCKESCIPDWKNDVRTIKVEKGITYLGNVAFTEMENLQTVIISNTVQEIGDGTFYECKSLKNITFSTNLKKIGNGSFNGCEKIQRLNLPEKLISIGDYAFEHCFGLIDVNFSEGLKSIGAGAFMNCQHITTVTIPSTVSKIGTDVFSYCSRLTTVYVKDKNSAPDGWNPNWVGTYGVEIIWNA